MTAPTAAPREMKMSDALERAVDAEVAAYNRQPASAAYYKALWIQEMANARNLRTRAVEAEKACRHALAWLSVNNQARAREMLREICRKQAESPDAKIAAMVEKAIGPKP